MDISNLHFHDTEILRVVEDTDGDSLTFEVDYPTDWDAKIFERRWIVFEDVLEYRVSEGPFQGSPTILDVTIVEHLAPRYRLQIDTNAGTRHLSCTDVRLLEHQPEAANKGRQATASPSPAP
ncbi:MAG: hypothetical protein JNJ70_08225 [Verrucomicrobiales bacterium]|nr:hypothetical protein [Verrucomicrobiales bacterium]